MQAQVSSYSFTSQSTAYTEITGGTVLATASGTSGAASLDDVVYNLAAGTIPFNFNFSGTNYTGCYVSTNGFITFGATAPLASGSTTGYTPLSAITAYSGAASALGRNLNAYFFAGSPSTTGEIRYQTLGSAPNRTFVVQYKNFKTFNTSGTTFGPSINLQIRLNETSNIIEFAYNCIGNIGAATAQVGLRGPNNTFPTNINNRIVANGVNTWPTSNPGTANTSTCEISGTLLPAGLVYRFSPILCSTPLSLFATNITQTSAQLTWSSAVTGTTFTVEYGPAGFTPGTGTIVNNAVSPLTISGLTQSTAYTFYVQQNCGANGLSQKVSANFTTGTIGEDCGSATTIPVASSLATCNYTTITSGISSNGPFGLCSDMIGRVGDDDRWVKFVAPSGGKKLTISTTAGTVNDWVMEVWSSCNAGAAMKCGDDDVGYMPQITLCQNEYVAGQTYYIRVWTYSNNPVSGTMNICVYQDGICAIPPVNDECTEAIRVPVNLPLSCPANAQTFSTQYASVNTFAATCDGFAKRDVYFVFNTGFYTGLNIQINPITATNLKAQLLFECGGFQINCFSPANGIYNFTGFNPVADYILRVWSDSGNTGTFSLCISATCSNPTATISGSRTVCQGTAAPLNVALTGVPPFTFTYTDGTTNTTVNTSNTSYTLNLAPTSSKVYTLVSMSDATCAGGVSGSGSIDVIVPATVTLANFTPVCSNNNPVLLTGGSPAGGVYTGTNVTNGVFNPAGGSKLITYTINYTTGCSRSASKTFTVNTAPVVALSSQGIVCNTAPAYLLSGGAPTGGVYSGVGVTNNILDPAVAGPGTFPITYTYTAANGCSASASNSVMILDCGGCDIFPTANAGADKTSCAGASVSITGSIGGSASTLTWTNGTGTYSPSNTSATITYTPSAAEISAGFAQLILVTDDPDGTGPCEPAKDTVLITIVNNTVTLANFTAVCINASPVTLTGGAPAGGQYTGTNVSAGLFNPSGGTQNITYTVTFAPGCSGSAVKSFPVNPLPTVTLGSIGTFCSTDQPVALNQGSPAGGTYSGTGVSNGNFSPSVAGVGTHNIFYTYTNANGCTNTANNTAVVNNCPACPNPATANAGTDKVVCATALPVSVTGIIGGSASTLTWSGGNGTYSPSNTAATINYTPTSAEINAGTVMLILTTNDPDGAGACLPAKDTVIITIVNNTVTLANFTAVCINASPVTLTGGAPAGGTYTGTNVSAGVFNPSGGSQNITYTVSFAGGCVGSAVKQFPVNPLPTVTLGSIGTYCSADLPVALTQGSPAGGNYSGPGVSNNTFSPSVAGVGTHTITYTYTNGNGCTNSATNTAVVNNCPACPNPATANAGTDKTVCTNAFPVSITGSIGGSASTATWSGGTGTYSPSNTSLVLNYTPSAAEVTAGSATLILTTNDPDGAGACVAAKDTVVITIRTVPALNAIAGNNIICRPATGEVFSVNAQTGVTYNWTVPANYTITAGQGTNSITVNIGTTAASGTISVTGANTCGTSTQSLAVTLRTSVPGTVGGITGTNSVCPGDSFEYKVAKVTGADYYVWYLPIGGTINGSSTTYQTTDTSVWVVFNAAFTGDTLQIKAGNCKGLSTTFRNYIITKRTTAPSTPGAVSGQVDGICGAMTLTYSHAAAGGAKTYTWRSTVAGTLFDGQPFPYTTTALSVNVTYPASWGAATTGNLYVKANNGCGSSTERAVAITSTPTRPTTINGVFTQCVGATNVNYTCTVMPGATSYQWVMPSGTTLVSGQGTSSILVNFTTTGNKTLRVSSVNACGTSTQRTQNITVNNCVKSGVRMAETSPELGLSVYPNPAKNLMHVTIESPEDGTCTLKLYDMEGKFVRIIPVPVNAGQNTITMEINGLMSGLYVLQAEGGHSSNQLRVMIE